MYLKKRIPILFHRQTVIVKARTLNGHRQTRKQGIFFDGVSCTRVCRLRASETAIEVYNKLKHDSIASLQKKPNSVVYPTCAQLPPITSANEMPDISKLGDGKQTDIGKCQKLGRGTDSGNVTQNVTHQALQKCE
eukprot:Gregarina_sp_Poly_1__1375@NODE_1340_length_4345_cov_84_710145_g900_i0_p5_GENE_NODE_1340_length_4345_cov_84_710145_g900_i0NODE_1340_length_4345_cov_84_710145_g900_i0_p5_ORF_typecomplete_len135_score8_81_NODE_1340_length_4345_cov_84_710145_g900_i024232827